MDLIEQLELSGKKKDLILRLQDAHFQKKDALMKRNRTLHERLFQSFNDPKKDRNAIASLIDDIVENQREIEQMTFDYFKKIDSLCTPEQRIKLQNTIHKVLSRVGGPPPRK
jgi:Spy/CpxP family protein refolding chaperone